MSRPDLDAIRARWEHYKRCNENFERARDKSGTSANLPSAPVQADICDAAQLGLEEILLENAPALLAYLDDLEARAEKYRKAAINAEIACAYADNQAGNTTNEELANKLRNIEEDYD